MKKFLALLLCFFLVVACFAGCKNKKKTTDNSSDDSSGEYIESSVDPENGGDEEPEEPADIGDEGYNNGGGTTSVGRHVITTTSTYTEKITDPNAGLSQAELRARKIILGTDEQFLLDCIYKDTSGNYAGNMTRVANFIRKAQSGKDTNMVVFGGANCKGDDSYAQLLKDQLESQLDCNINLYEYGLDNISSDKAVFLIKEHIIDYKPDLVLLDISVDDSSKKYSIYYENVVRRILSETSAGLILIINAGCDVVTYDLANQDPIQTNEKYAKEIAQFYKIPVIDYNTAVWDIITNLVVKKTYSELPLVTWSDFGDSFKKLSDIGKANLANAVAKYIEIVTGKLNDSSTKTAPALGNVNDANTYKYKVNKYMGFSSIDILKMRGNGINGYKILNKEDDLIYTGGNAAWLFVEKNTTKTELQYLRATDPVNENGASVPLEIQIPKTTSTDRAHLIFATLGSTTAKSSSSYGPITVTCYDSNNKSYVVKGNLLSSGTGYGAVCLPITLAEGTVKISIKVGTTNNGIALVGIARG